MRRHLPHKQTHRMTRPGGQTAVSHRARSRELGRKKRRRLRHRRQALSLKASLCRPMGMYREQQHRVGIICRLRHSPNRFKLPDSQTASRHKSKQRTTVFQPKLVRIQILPEAGQIMRTQTNLQEAAVKQRNLKMRQLRQILKALIYYLIR